VIAAGTPAESVIQALLLEISDLLPIAPVLMVNIRPLLEYLFSTSAI
jgi:hypothetical protein